MSTVFYRWGAGRDESRVTFDGTHISVFDLKREIILNNKMGNGKDFDLGIFDNVTGEEFKDDHHQIPRSSSLIARRLPASAKGRGNAQHYIAGTTAADSLANEHRLEANARAALLAKQSRGAGGTFGSMTKRFDGKEEKRPEAIPISTGDAEEDAKIQAMFAQNADQWEQMQEDMSSRPNAAVHRARQTKAAPKAKFDYSVPTDKEPPVGYICYRCGQKGHWIQDCPLGDDPTAAEKKRFVRVTGIPRSFLKTVETPGNEGSSQGAMLTADGGFVQAMPDKRLWDKLAGAKPRTLTNAEVRDQQPLDASITCSICKKLVWEAMRVPCCNTASCEECIQNYLLEHDFECPMCESKVPSLDALKVDEELRERVKGYVEGEIERSKKEEEKEEEDKKDVKTEGDQPEVETVDQAKMQEMMNPQTMQTYLGQVAKMMQNPRITAQGKTVLQAQLQMVQSSMLQMQMMMMNGSGGNGNANVAPGLGMGMGMGMGNGNGNGNAMGQGNNFNMNNGMTPMNNGNGNGNENGNMMDNMMQMGMMDMAMNLGMGMGMGMPGMGMGMGMPGMGMQGMPGMSMGMGPGMGMGMGMNPQMNMNGMGGMGGMNGMGNQGFGMGQGMGMGGGRGRGGMPFRGGGFRGRGGGVGARSGIPIPTVRPPKRNGEEADLDFGVGGGEKVQRLA